MASKAYFLKAGFNVPGYEALLLAETRGLSGWTMDEVYARVKSASNKRKSAATILQECKDALAVSDAQMKEPRNNKRDRPIAGGYAESADEGSDHEPKPPTDAPTKPPAKPMAEDPAYIPDKRPEAASHTGEAAPEGKEDAEESSSSEEEDEQTPTPDAPIPTEPQPDLRLTEEEIAEFSDSSPIPFPKEATTVKSPEAEAMITALRALKTTSEGGEELFSKVQPLLRPEAVPMEHQKRAAKFLRDAIAKFNVAGNALGCGLGKTFTTILYVLHTKGMGVICGKAVLYETWRQEIARVMPEGSYTVANIGAESFRSIRGGYVWRTGVLDPVLASLGRGSPVFLYVHQHVLNMPHDLLSLVTELIDMAAEGATLIVEESHEYCRTRNVPCEALGALARRCRGTVFISATPIMGDGDEARHMMQTGNGHLPRKLDPSDALKVWRELCFRAGEDTALPPLGTWILRVPPVQGLSGLSGQAQSRAAVHGNGVDASAHTKYQAAAAAVLALIKDGCSPLVCMENRKGAAQFREMLLPQLGDTRCFVLSGDTPEAERETALGDVQRLHGEGQRTVVCVTPQVGGAGLNLQSLGAVVLVGLPWSKQDIEQIVARVHRIGQAQPCLCVVLVTGEADQEVLNCVQEKMRSTAAFYGDNSRFLLPKDHIDRLGVCPIEGVAAAVGDMRARLMGNSPAQCANHEGAAQWALFTRP